MPSWLSPTYLYNLIKYAVLGGFAYAGATNVSTVAQWILDLLQYLIDLTFSKFPELLWIVERGQTWLDSASTIVNYMAFANKFLPVVTIVGIFLTAYAAKLTIRLIRHLVGLLPVNAG